VNRSSRDKRRKMRRAGEWTSAACARRTTDSANQTRDAPSQTNDEGTDAFPTRITEPSKESDADTRLTLANVMEQPASFYPVSFTKPMAQLPISPYIWAEKKFADAPSSRRYMACYT
jgi:hypothetical protein